MPEAWPNKTPSFQADPTPLPSGQGPPKSSCRAKPGRHQAEPLRACAPVPLPWPYLLQSSPGELTWRGGGWGGSFHTRPPTEAPPCSARPLQQTQARADGEMPDPGGRRGPGCSTPRLGSIPALPNATTGHRRVPFSRPPLLHLRRPRLPQASVHLGSDRVASVRVRGLAAPG